MEVLMRDWYCFECLKQFDNKHLFDIHLSAFHGEKLHKKQNDLNDKGKKEFKCDICNANYGHKSQMNRHIATIHKRKHL